VSDLEEHWVSIVIPKNIVNVFEYHGPWWITGYDAADARIVCAGVMATDEEAAYETLMRAFDTGTNVSGVVRRFSELKTIPDRSNPSGRFEWSDWMNWPWPIKPLEPRP